MINYAVNSEELLAFEIKVFEAAGLPEKDARSVAELLIDADLRNVRSHGVLRTVPYVEKILDGGASRDTTFPIIKETPNTAVIDAQGGLGALVAEKAVAICREKAEKNLLSMVVVKNSNHFGMGAHWCFKLAGKDMIGCACSNTDLTMGPPNSKEPFMGNNPVGFAVYCGEKYPEFCVDMATSMAAMGKCKDLAKRGKEIPHGLMLDKDGNDTQDVTKCYMMTPMAAHKGFGIALMVEMFATLLSGGVLSPDINNQDLTDTPELSSQVFACFNIAAFRDPAEYHADAERYIDRLHELPMKEGCGAAKYPGEIEYACKQVNKKDGVVLPETLCDDLIELAGRFHIDGSFLKARVTDRT